MYCVWKEGEGIRAQGGTGVETGGLPMRSDRVDDGFFGKQKTAYEIGW